MNVSLLWIIELQMSADDSAAKRDNDKNMAKNSRHLFGTFPGAGGM